MTGLEVIERGITLAGTSLTAGQFVVTLAADDNDILGGSLGVMQQDLFVLDVTEATKNMIDGTANATGFLLVGCRRELRCGL